MNTVILIGRLTKKPEIRYANDLPVAKYSLAVDRKFKKLGTQQVDFIPCVAFGKNAEFAEKYLDKGTKIGVTGRIQTGSYKAQDGSTRYTTDVIVESHEFVTSKSDTGAQSVTERFEDATQEELPFV